MSESRWSSLPNRPDAREYAARFAALESEGRDVHGEASFCADLLAPGSRVLDGGCGTGRVAARLADLGHTCVGVDSDEAMLAEARRARPDLTWLGQDLASLDLTGTDVGPPFDLVVLAGNVVPLLAEGTLDAAVHSVASHLVSGGLLVAGFGLDAAHLPPGCPATDIARYDEACAWSGLALVDRFAGWDRETYGDRAAYAVSVHLRR